VTANQRFGMFAKYWAAGRVKTRLARNVGAQAAAGLYLAFLETLLRRFQDQDQAELVFTPERCRPSFGQLVSATVPRIEGPVSFADVIAAVSPAVVNISVEKLTRTSFSGGQPSRGLPEGTPFDEFFGRFFNGPQGGMPERRAQALGSGFIVSADGYIVTNNHVVADSDTVTVILADGSELEADVVGIDERTDLAVLKIAHADDLPFVERPAVDKCQ